MRSASAGSAGATPSVRRRHLAQGRGKFGTGGSSGPTRCRNRRRVPRAEPPPHLIERRRLRDAGFLGDAATRGRNSLAPHRQTCDPARSPPARVADRLHAPAFHCSTASHADAAERPRRSASAAIAASSTAMRSSNGRERPGRVEPEADRRSRQPEVIEPGQQAGVDVIGKRSIAASGNMIGRPSSGSKNSAAGPGREDDFVRPHGRSRDAGGAAAA